MKLTRTAWVTLVLAMVVGSHWANTPPYGNSVVTVGMDPEDVEAGDFNVDDVPDLAVANFHSDDISVVLGLGGARFSSETRLPAGNGPLGISVADLDADNDADIVTANYWSDDISIFLGLGDGTFADEVRLPVGDGPRDVVVRDFDRDGRVDLAVAGAFAEVAILLGNGEGDFTLAGSYPVGRDATEISARDLDGDGLLDLAFSGHSPNGVSVVLGNGDGTFGPYAAFEAGVIPLGIDAIDLDGDGDIDLATANRGGPYGDVSVLLGNGDGTFAPPVSYVAGLCPQDVALVDLDGDGRPDMVAVNEDSEDLSLFAGLGDGTFAPEVRLGTSPIPTAILVTDLDGNGRPDVAVTNEGHPDWSGDKITLHLDELGKTISARAPFTSDNVPRIAIVDDFDEDGFEDLAVGNFSHVNGSGQEVVILRGHGDGTFDPPGTPHPVGPNPDHLASGDFNGDGHRDVAVANNGWGGGITNDISILIGDGAGSFAPEVRYDVVHRPNEILVADLNEDDKPDLIVSTTGAVPTMLLTGQGNGIFDPATELHPGFTGQFVAAADFDGNGSLDLAAVETAGVEVLLGQGDATFTALPVLPLINGFSLTAEDLDGDVVPDLVVTDLLGEIATVFLGQGDGTFVQHQQIATGRAYEVVAEDIDGDGTKDLLLRVPSQTVVLFARGRGDGSFDPTDRFAGPAALNHISVGDLRGDGRLDLIVTHIASDDRGLSVFLNRSAAPPVLSFDDKITLSWPEVHDADGYHVYRGKMNELEDQDEDGLPDAGYGTCRTPLDPTPRETSFVDSDLPSAGVGFFYLVGFVRDGIEIGLGLTSGGEARQPSAPCP